MVPDIRRVRRRLISHSVNDRNGLSCAQLWRDVARNFPLSTVSYIHSSWHVDMLGHVLPLARDRLVCKSRVDADRVPGHRHWINGRFSVRANIRLREWNIYKSLLCHGVAHCARTNLS